MNNSIYKYEGCNEQIEDVLGCSIHYPLVKAWDNTKLDFIIGYCVGYTPYTDYKYDIVVKNGDLIKYMNAEIYKEEKKVKQKKVKNLRDLVLTLLAEGYKPNKEGNWYSPSYYGVFHKSMFQYAGKDVNEIVIDFSVQGNHTWQDFFIEEID